MQRNRTVRLAVLGSSVQRTAGQRYPSRSGTALKRRLVVGLLVLLSFTLITVSFRESDGGGLHSAQALAASALHPLQVAIERVVRPFRDLYGYGSDLVHARSENERLHREVARYRQEAIQYRSAFDENRLLLEMTNYRAPPSYPADYEPVRAAITAYSPAQLQQGLVIAAGSRDGVRVDDPVVSSAGNLVGQVTRVEARASKVTLLTDESSAVSARVLRRSTTGIIVPGRAGSGVLSLDYVRKSSFVREGDVIVTLGSRQGSEPSLYPRRIPVGRVTAVDQSDTDAFKTVLVEPLVDFGSLDGVVVLVERRGAR